MSDETWLIRENLDDSIAHIILNRPPVNTYNSAFLDQWPQCWIS